MAFTPTHDNSLLKGKLPTSNPNNIANLQALTDDNATTMINLNASSTIVYDLGYDSDITHYLLAGGSGSNISFLDKNNVELAVKGESSGYRDKVIADISSTPILKVRFIKVYIGLNDLSSVNVWGIEPKKYKILILSSGSYKKYSASSWQTVASTTPTELDYLQGNTLEDISLIPESAWQQLTGSVEMCYYTDDAVITEAQFNVETNPFTLADEFEGKEIKVLEYTDNPSQVESKVETEVEPYSIYDEFGDTMEVLYYTDDTAKTKADLEITANYSPLDELTGDFEVVTWSNAIDEVVQEAIPQLSDKVVAEGTVYETPLNLENVVKVK